MAGYAQSVGVLDRHHVVGLEVRVRDVHKRVDVVLGEVHHIAVDGADVSENNKYLQLRELSKYWLDGTI